MKDNMIKPDILPILRCPVTGESLTFADAELIARINTEIEAGEARDRLDEKVNRRIDGGLVPADQPWMYPIRENIPTLIADNAIRIN